MSTEQKDHEGDSTEGENQVSLEQFNELRETVTRLSSTNERLLTESKTNKDKYNKLKGEVDEKENQTLTQKGDMEALLKKANSRSIELESSLANTQKLAVMKDLKFEVSKHAGDAHSVDAIVNAIDMDNLEYDQEGLTFKNVASEIDRIKKKDAWMFKSTTEMKQTMPRYKEDKPSDYLSELKMCTTQSEMDRVRRKYGRDPNYN